MVSSELVVKLIDESIDQLNALIEADRCKEALDLTQQVLEQVRAAGGDPRYEGFAQLGMARAIHAGVTWAARQPGAAESGGPARAQVEWWVGLIPEGREAARRAFEMLPGFPQAAKLHTWYEERAAQFSTFRTGQVEPDGLFAEFDRLIKLGDTRYQQNEYLSAIEAYEGALAAMQKAGHANDEWEALARFKAARTIMNGSYHAAELAAGDYGRAGEIKESEGDLIRRFHELAPHGLREMETAARLLPTDRGIQKGLVAYRQWTQTMPWLFDPGWGKKAISDSSSSPTAGRSRPDTATAARGSGFGWWKVCLILLALALVFALSSARHGGRIPPPPQSAPVNAVKTLYATRAVTVRSGPSKHNQAIATLKRGELVRTAGGYSNGWAKVAYRGGKEGWVWRDYLGASMPRATGSQQRTVAR